MDLLLDVEGRGIDDEVAPVLLVLAAPHELGIEVGIARVFYLARAFLFPGDDALVLGGGDVLPGGVGVAEGFDGLGRGRGFGHGWGKDEL